MHPDTEPTIQQLFGLQGKRVLLTGGCGHLGSALARGLAEAGASVVLTSRDGIKAEAAASRLTSIFDAEHQGIALDHMDPPQLESAFSAVTERGPIDVLVNNGHEALANDWTTVEAEQFNRHLANATGYFLLARLFRDHVVQRGSAGSVIMLGSMYGQVASYPDVYAGICTASPVAYHTLKGGILHMTRHLAVYWAADGVRVNSLSPGPFPSETAPAEMVARLHEKSPLRRMGKPHELKGAVVFLASDASSYVTGHNLVVDGGWTSW